MQRFKMWAEDIDSSLKKAGGDANVVTLVAPTREQIRARFAELDRQAKPDDAFVLMLIGHGAYDGAEYKFNIPGPDITGAELASLLDHMPATRQLVVNMTSSSGGSIEFLRKPNRVVIAATKTGTRKERHRVRALLGRSAARSRRGYRQERNRLGARSLPISPQQKTTNFFETQKRLATEHSVLEDTGKGEGEKSPSAENGEGRLAASFPVVRLGSNAAAARDPAKKRAARSKGTARAGDRQTEVRQGRHAAEAQYKTATDAAPAPACASAGGDRQVKHLPEPLGRCSQLVSS